eukprot:SAG31_NODE_71_length_28115_cov_4.128105_23_plen_83_part_00
MGQQAGASEILAAEANPAFGSGAQRDSNVPIPLPMARLTPPPPPLRRRQVMKYGIDLLKNPVTLGDDGEQNSFSPPIADAQP